MPWLAGLILLLAGASVWHAAPLVPGPASLQFAATPAAFAAIVHAWPADHLQRYRELLAADALMLPLLALLGRQLVARSGVARGVPAAVRAALALGLPAAALAGLAHDALHAWLVAVPRFDVAPLYALATGLALAKWALGCAFALALAWGLAFGAAAPDDREPDMDPSLAVHRNRYAEAVVRAAGVADERLSAAFAADRLVAAFAADRLVAAFAAVPREDFAGPPPWTLIEGGHALRSDDPRELYRDALVALAPERGINNGEPSLHALCLAACAPAAGERVLQVGAGTGYYSAILAELVGPQGHVVAYEIEADLAARARAALARWPGVEVVTGSAAQGPLPQADVIYVSAGASHPPAAWLDALAPGGRLVFPLTADDGRGPMLLVTRRAGSAWPARALTHVAFIPCRGARDAAAADALRVALATRPIGAIRSLHRGEGAAADPLCWCAGAGWWLSGAAA